MLLDSLHHASITQSIMKVMRKDDFAWLNVPAEVAARRLLGCELVREIGGREIRVRAGRVWLGRADTGGRAVGGNRGY